MRSYPKIKSISIVIPAYRQEKTIERDIARVDQALSSISQTHEVIIVVDGFEDNTFSKARKIKLDNLKVLGYKKNRGKGYAVKYGVLRAKSDVVGFLDAGMDISPDSIGNLVNVMTKKSADIVVGSKIHKDSRVNYPFLRKLFSWGYRNFIRWLFGFNVKDTQVGLKIFTKVAAKDIFEKVKTQSYAFDIEVLALATLMGYKIAPAPVVVNLGKRGSITSANFWIVILKMLFDTISIYYRLKLSNAYDKGFTY